MGILTKKQIVEYLKKNELIKDARKKDDGSTFDVEAASYDLSVGIVVKKRENCNIFQKRTQKFELQPQNEKKKKRDTITLGPGQMLFVITHEEIMMPENLCGTVYSRNSLAQKGILALNAGHIDPGFCGPITIKLINLRSIDYTFKLGDPIFTIVFQTIDDKDGAPGSKRVISKEDTLKRVFEATDVSLNNALYDLALLREFVKESEFGRALRKWLFKTFWGLVAFIFGSLFTIIAVTASVIKLMEYLKTNGYIK